MSARPDLTTEELILRHQRDPGYVGNSRALYVQLRELERLRSERPAVTPETYDLMRGKMAKPPVHGPREDFRCACDACLEAALRVRGEPSREPTLEDRFSLEDSLRSGYLFGNYDEPLDDYGKRIVRAILVRLSSPEAPRSPDSTWPLETHVQETPPLEGTVEPNQEDRP